jgi:type IV pilus assembly protein PilP
MSHFKSSWMISALLGGFVLLSGCGETPPEAPPVVPPPVKRAVQAPAPDSAKMEVPPPDASQSAPAFVYDPAGRRDPFESLVALKKPTGPALDAPKTPLQGYELGQLRLIGVIIGKGQPRAMVVAPDGKSYILTKGVRVGKNEGIVKNITSEAVTIEEQYVEFTGEVRKAIQLIQLPKREGV